MSHDDRKPVNGLKFCMVTTFYPPYNFGGDGVGIQRLSRALVRRGHDVTVLVDTDPFRQLSGGRDPERVSDSDGVKIVALHSWLGAASVMLTHQFGRPVVHGRTIRRLLRDGGFDVINFHNISLVGGPGILSAGDALKIYMAHEHWLVCPSHVLWRHNREACDSKECLRCVLAFRRPPQLWRYTGFLERQLRHVDAFVAMSEFSRSKHREFGFPREMETVSYFLPDPAPSGNGDHGDRPHSRPYFLFVGRLERIKGLDDVIPAFRNYPEADLLIAGNGEHAGALKALAGDSPNVRFLGRLEFSELERYYRHALALIVPSAGFETFGIIIIEAFRMSTPVIARRIGPFPEIVERAQGGELFDRPGELVEAMRRIQGDPAYRNRLAAAGREAFTRYWSEDAVVPRYLEIVGKAAMAKGRRDLVTKLGVEVEA